MWGRNAIDASIILARMTNATEGTPACPWAVGRVGQARTATGYHRVIVMDKITQLRCSGTL